MLSEKENEILTRVDRGSPCGELLRRYWHPVALTSELNETTPKKRLTLLGEQLVLFLKPNGHYGLVAENCLHRRTSLYYGFLEEAGIRCAYHGWLFDENGNCIEKPFEPNEVISPRNKLPGYPVEELGGLLFAYLGPFEKKPLLPKWDILARSDGIRHFEIQEDLECNWLQMQENAVDVTHTYFLHSYMFYKKGLSDSSGFNLPLKTYGFQPFEWGILKSWSYYGENSENSYEGWGNLMVFPNILRIMTEMHWRVPVDNTKTRIFWVGFTPSANPVNPEDAAYKIVYQPARKDNNGEYTLTTFSSQDAMAVETQGAIADRTTEVLGASDIGIVMFRRLLANEIEVVQTDGDPIGTVRDPENDRVIDLREWMGGYLPMSAPDDETAKKRKLRSEVFDDRHTIVELPYRDVFNIDKQPDR